MFEDGILETTLTLATAEKNMTGTFANILVEALPDGFDYSVEYLTNSLAVTISANQSVPEPATWTGNTARLQYASSRPVHAVVQGGETSGRPSWARSGQLSG